MEAEFNSVIENLQEQQLLIVLRGAFHSYFSVTKVGVTRCGN